MRNLRKNLRAIFIFILIFESLNTFSQVKFNNGYIISNDSVKTECLIKNEDWNKNPTSFKYKLPTDEEVKTGSIANVKEFGIYNHSKYIRAEVKVDMSPSTLDKLSHFKSPLWENKVAFLKVLIEGDAMLYRYKEKEVEVYFYKTKKTSIDQLVYKEYFMDQDVTAINDSFKIQLRNNVFCENSKIRTRYSPNYNKSGLTDYFTRYNQCVDPSYKVVKNNYQRDILNISLFTGFDCSSLKTTNSVGSDNNNEYKKEYNPLYGVGVEYILPINQNKWGLLAELNYTKYKSDNVTAYRTYTIDYKSMGLALGVRYYCFLNSELKIFMNGIYNSLISENYDSKIIYKPLGHSLDLITLKNRQNIALGMGVEYKRLSGEIRYYTKQNISSQYAFWGTAFQRVSLKIGYKIIKLTSAHKKK